MQEGLVFGEQTALVRSRDYHSVLVRIYFTRDILKSAYRPCTCQINYESLCSYAGLLPLLQGIPFAKLVVKYCAVNDLPHILQKYLDMHKLSSDMDTTKELLQSAGEVQWVHWLILSRVPSQAFATTIANARAVLPEAKFESLTDLANKGSAHMLLSAIADQPGRLAEVMTSDAPASNEAPARDLQSNGPKASLCNIEPSCTLEALETSLKPYPTLLSSLQGVKMLEEYKGKATKQEYLKWRERIFGVEGINLVDLIPNKEGSDFRKLLKMCASCPGAENGNGSWSQEVSNWEQETIVDLHEWLGMITAHEAGNGSALGVCHHLLSGHPLAALKWYLVSKEDQVSPHSCTRKRIRLRGYELLRALLTMQIGENLELQNLDQFLCLPNQDIIFLERLTRLVALQNWQAPTVVSACMVMACVCGISVTPMKVDATVLQKLGDKQDCDVHSLAADLLKEVQSGQKVTNLSTPRSCAFQSMSSCQLSIQVLIYISQMSAEGLSFWFVVSSIFLGAENEMGKASVRVEQQASHCWNFWRKYAAQTLVKHLGRNISYRLVEQKVQ